MLEVKGINNGIVLDHIKAGNGLKVFSKLSLDKSDQPVVLVMNVKSNNLDRKDIIKIENTTNVDLDVLGLIDSNITVNIIKDGCVANKQSVTVPEQIKGLFKCKNPRCITNEDDYMEPTFTLVGQNGVLEYSCPFCDEITKYKNK